MSRFGGSPSKYCSQSCYRIATKKHTAQKHAEIREQSLDAGIFAGKVCSRCKEWKPFEQFGKHPSKPDGLFYVCNECTNKRNRESEAQKVADGTARRFREKTLDPSGMKTCRRCRVAKEYNHFFRNSWMPDGFDLYCKPCSLEKKRVWEASNRNVVKAMRLNYAKRQKYPDPSGGKTCKRCGVWLPHESFHKNPHSKDGFGQNCKNCHLELGKRWRQNNRRRYCDYSLAYAKRNPEKAKECQRLWRKANPILCRLARHKRRLKVTANGGSFTQREWFDLCEKYGNVCLKCGKAEKLTIDHILPISKGGSNSIDNLQPLCKPCNSSKGTRHIDYRKVAG